MSVLELEEELEDEEMEVEEKEVQKAEEEEGIEPQIHGPLPAALAVSPWELDEEEIQNEHSSSAKAVEAEVPSADDSSDRVPV